MYKIVDEDTGMSVVTEHFTTLKKAQKELNFIKKNVSGTFYETKENFMKSHILIFSEKKSVSFRGNKRI